MQDGVYELHKSDKWYFFIEIKNNNLMFQGDNGESSDLNVTYVLGSADDTHHFLTHLRLKYSTRDKLETMLKNEFGSDDGADLLISVRKTAQKWKSFGSECSNNMVLKKLCQK